MAYANPRRGGIIAINLDEGDELIAAARTSGQPGGDPRDARGKSIRFHETQVRPMGRTATGVRGIRLQDDDEVVGMEILSPGATILTVTENGYGKRTPLEDYRLQNRGGQGIITIRTSERNGDVVGVAQVVDDDEVMLITDGGKVLRCRVSGISTMGRATQGVRLMDLEAREKIVSVARLAEREDAAGTEVRRTRPSRSGGRARARDRPEDEPEAELETDRRGRRPAGRTATRSSRCGARGARRSCAAR